MATELVKYSCHPLRHGCRLFRKPFSRRIFHCQTVLQLVMLSSIAHLLLFKWHSTCEKDHSSIVLLTPTPIPENAIHFVITKAFDMAPKIRELCFIETAAKLHPQRAVTVSLNSQALNRSDLIKSLLQEHENLFFRKLEMKEIIKGTPLDGWYQNSSIDGSSYQLTFDSDISRVVLLYKYGGWYIDSDLLLLKPVDDLVNVITTKWDSPRVNPNFLAFSKGHPFLYDCMTTAAAVRYFIHL